MDWVVVTRSADMHLLRYLLASAECFFRSAGRLVLFTSRRDKYVLDKLDLPPGTRLVYRDDFPELGDDDYCNQLYLKLRAHEFVETEHFLILDSDFLFVAPCEPADFFHDGKPIWFHAPWDDQTLRFRAASEAFVRAPIERFYMPLPQWVYTRRVARQLAECYDLQRILHDRSLSEHVIYAWFAHRHFPECYSWVDLDHADIQPIVALVNQRPPTYCLLDPHVSLDDFPVARFVVFWSHWDIAEAKMREFLEAAHLRWPGRQMIIPEAKPIFVPIDPLASLEQLYAEIRGLYSDGWVRDEVRFAVVGANSGFRLRLEFHVPRGPISGSFRIGPGVEERFTLESGIGKLEAQVDSGTDYCPAKFQIDGVTGANGSGDRRLVARLIGLWVTPTLGQGIETGTVERLRDKNREIARLTAQLSARTGMVNEQYRRAESMEHAAEERLAVMMAIRNTADERLAFISQRDREIARLRAQIVGGYQDE